MWSGALDCSDLLLSYFYHITSIAYDQYINIYSQSYIFISYISYAGLSTNINPALIISRLPKGVSLPHLRKRLLRVAHQYKFRSFATDRCNDILAGDTLGLQVSLDI